jgi:threonine synthase
VDKDEHVVCVTTGHGLKDPDTAVKMSKKPIEVKAQIEAIEEILGLEKHRPLTVSGEIS